LEVYTNFFEMSSKKWYTSPMETIDTLATIALVLSDPIRLRILDLLVIGRDASCRSVEHPQFPLALCPRDLQQKLGDITPSKLSYHLKELREARLIQEHRTGKYIYYTPNQPALEHFFDAMKQRYLIARNPQDTSIAPSPHEDSAQWMRSIRERSFPLLPE
jgi:ArsR family transcriptional regulator, arsenate/arsenite/antimonite-responsive transcriptional repressor